MEFSQFEFYIWPGGKDNDDGNNIIPVQFTVHPECEGGDFAICVSDASKNIYLDKVKKIGDYDDGVLISFMSSDLSLNLKMQLSRLPTCTELRRGMS